MGNRLSQFSQQAAAAFDVSSGSASLSRDSSSRDLSSSVTAGDCVSTLSLVGHVAESGESPAEEVRQIDEGGLHNLGFCAPSLKDVNDNTAAAVTPEDPPPPRPQPRTSSLTSSSPSSSSPPSSPNPAGPPQQQQAASRPRICPIVQNGRQVTKDFYWVLPERRHGRLARQRSLHEPPQPPRTPLPSDASQEDEELYQNLPSSSPAPPRRHRSCRSESGSGAAATARLVDRVRRQVPGSTEDEGRLALGLHGWDVGRAVRYLMVEQLFRLGLAERLECKAELEAAGWRLEAAGAALVNRTASAQAATVGDS